MSKTSKEATVTKAKTAKRAAGKAAPAATSRNGAQYGRMSEKLKQETLRAFQMAYEQHHPEEAAAAPAKPIKQIAGKQEDGAQAASAKRKSTRPKHSEMTTEEITLTAFRKVHEQHAQEAEAAKAKAQEDTEQTATAGKKRNGATPVKLSEKIRRATLRSFQLAYESHQRKMRNGSNNL